MDRVLSFRNAALPFAAVLLAASSAGAQQPGPADDAGPEPAAEVLPVAVQVPEAEQDLEEGESVEDAAFERQIAAEATEPVQGPAEIETEPPPAPAEPPAGPTLDENEQGLLDRLLGFTGDDAFSIGGVGFFRYWYNLEGAAPDANSFELWRLYVDFKAKMNSWLSMRFTPDVGPASEVITSETEDHTHTLRPDNRYTLFVKFAWFNVALPEGFSIRAGLIDSPWTGYVDNFIGYRYLFKGIADEERVLYTADLGIHVAWKLPEDLGDLVVAFVNGVGFRSALDGDEYKSLQARLSLAPFAPFVEALETFQIGAFVSYPIAQDDPSIG
jgi:hypothetical protein